MEKKHSNTVSICGRAGGGPRCDVTVVRFSWMSEGCKAHYRRFYFCVVILHFILYLFFMFLLFLSNTLFHCQTVDIEFGLYKTFYFFICTKCIILCIVGRLYIGSKYILMYKQCVSFSRSFHRVILFVRVRLKMSNTKYIS